MFAIYDKNKNLYPIKIWLNHINEIDESCLEQAQNLSNLPFLHKWVCLMPDTHAGKGMPVGGVIAAKNVIIPNAVGSDIGCGMAFAETDFNVDELTLQTGNGTLLQLLIGDILRNIPVGFNHHKSKQYSATIDAALSDLSKYENQKDLLPEIGNGYFQIGTLGGGNHFIELQKDENNNLTIMVHSGSRHLGNKVCSYFHNCARELNSKWYSQVPDSMRLAFLPVDTQCGKDYIQWMNLCLDFAYENRQSILAHVKALLEKSIFKFTNKTINYTSEINCHHNYASLETHYNETVWVHRKGATRANEGELGIIPGAMGSYSYIVEGKGNWESFCSSSHGAGRRYSRKRVLDAFTCEEVILDLKQNGVVLGKRKRSDIAEESRFAYKDIENVMSNQTDLVTPIKKLKTIGVVKG